mgnify:CR=1 FL=1
MYFNILETTNALLPNAEYYLPVFLLVTILAQSLLAFVRRYLMSFTLSSTRHNQKSFKVIKNISL